MKATAKINRRTALYPPSPQKDQQTTNQADTIQVLKQFLNQNGGMENIWQAPPVISKVCGVSSVKTVLSRCVPKSLLPSHLQSKHPGTARSLQPSPLNLMEKVVSVSTCSQKFQRFSSRNHRNIEKGKKKKKNLDEVRRKRAVERRENSPHFPTVLGAVLPEGPSEGGAWSGRSWQLPGLLFWRFVTTVRGGTCLPRL